MSKFISVHVTSCMTRQDVERLVKRFIQESTDEIVSLSVQCDTVKGRMVCSWEAPGEDQLVAWLAKRNVRFRGDEEWIIRVQMETDQGTLRMV